MPNRASYTIWEGSGFCIFVDGRVVGGTMPEWDAKAVVRWLNDGGDKLILRIRAMNVDSSGVLTRDELDVIRKHFADDDFDDIDIGALIDHADAIEASYQDLVERGAQEADRTQALVLQKEEELAAHADLHRQAAHRIEQLARETRRVEACLRAVEAERDQLRDRLKATEGERDRAVSRLVAVTNATGASL